MEGIFSREIKRWGQLNTEFDMKEVDFNVSNKEISEPINLEVQDIIFKFKLQKASEIDGIIAEILQKVGPAVWRTHSLIKII
jgi:predicted secreted protein